MSELSRCTTPLLNCVLELEGLRHLRELKADGNKIASLDGLEGIDSLVKLSLQGNSIQTIDLSQYRWCVCIPFPFLLECNAD